MKVFKVVPADDHDYVLAAYRTRAEAEEFLEHAKESHSERGDPEIIEVEE